MCGCMAGNIHVVHPHLCTEGHGLSSAQVWGHECRGQESLAAWEGVWVCMDWAHAATCRPFVEGRDFCQGEKNKPLSQLPAPDELPTLHGPPGRGNIKNPRNRSPAPPNWFNQGLVQGHVCAQLPRREGSKIPAAPLAQCCPHPMMQCDRAGSPPISSPYSSPRPQAGVPPPPLPAGLREGGRESPFPIACLRPTQGCKAGEELWSGCQP